MRELLRTRKQLGRQQSSHIRRLQKTMEGANIELEIPGVRRAPLRSPLSRVHLAGAFLSFVVRDRELDPANRRVAARHILTDGHPAAVMRTYWIAGDFARHDDALQWKRVVVPEGYVDDQKLSRVPPVLLCDR